MDRIPSLRSRPRARPRWIRRAAAVLTGVLAVLIVASMSAGAHPHKSAPTPPAEPIPTTLHFEMDTGATCRAKQANKEPCDERDHGLHPMEDMAVAVGATLERADTGEPVVGVRVNFYRLSTGEGVCFGLTQDDGKVHCEATHEFAGIAADNGFIAVFEGNGEYARSEAEYTLELQESQNGSGLP